MFSRGTGMLPLGDLDAMPGTAANAVPAVRGDSRRFPTLAGGRR